MCDVVRRIGGRNSHPEFHRVLAVVEHLRETRVERNRPPPSSMMSKVA